MTLPTSNFGVLVRLKMSQRNRSFWFFEKGIVQAFEMPDLVKGDEVGDLAADRRDRDLPMS